MNIVLFGATGGTGKQVLLQALEQGHTVTAVVRSPSKITITDQHLHVVKGDVLNISSFKNALQKQDAVICCLGAPANKAGKLRSQGTKNIIETMNQAGVQRFICQSSLGFADSTEVLNNTSFVFKRIIVPFVLKATFREHHLQETIIKQSNLHWTIVRPGSLTNGKRTGNYQYGFAYTNPSVKVKIARADVAELMLHQLTNPEKVNSVIGVSY